MKYSEFTLGKYILIPKEGEGYINFISNQALVDSSPSIIKIAEGC